MSTTTTPIKCGGDPRLHQAARRFPDAPPDMTRRALDEQERRRAAKLLAPTFQDSRLKLALELYAKGEPLADALAVAELEEEDESEDAILARRLGSAWRWCARGCRAALDWCCAHSAGIAWSFAVAFLVATAALGSDPAARITMLAAHGMGLVGLGLLVFREAERG